MAIKFYQATLTAAATPVELIANIPGINAEIVFTNGSSSTEIYLGNSNTVTSANGTPVPAYGVIRLDDVGNSGPIWVTTAAAATGFPFSAGLIFADNN